MLAISSNYYQVRLVEVKDRTEPCPEKKDVYEAGYQM